MKIERAGYIGFCLILRISRPWFYWIVDGCRGGYLFVTDTDICELGVAQIFVLMRWSEVGYWFRLVEGTRQTDIWK